MMKKTSIFFLFIAVIIICTYYFWQNNLKAVNPGDKSSKIYVVQKGQSIKSVADSLKDAGLIKNDFIFVMYVRLNNLQNKIQAGDFRLSPSFDLITIINQLQHGTLDVIVTIPEGFRKEEIAQRIFSALNIPEEKFNVLAEEGYMFPDTYFLPKNSNATDVVSILKKNFYKRISTIDNNINSPNFKTPSGLTSNEAVILASIVEREAKYDEDRPIVSGILLKRLEKDWPLEVDATLQYILGYSADEKKWWRSNITLADLEIKSPYNLRKNKGFPPGPICNPGLSAIKSVFFPQKSNYWFYLSDKSGKMHYAKTIEEHSDNIKKYLN